MDEVAKEMLSVSWVYGSQDPNALFELEKRLAQKGRFDRDLTYSELVNGIEFRLPTVLNGRPFSIDVHSWTSLDRAIIGKFLGEISTSSYTKYGFMASALAISSSTQMPSGLFYDWMYEIGALKKNTDEAQMEFWTKHRGLAFDFYKSNSTVF